MKCFFAGSKRSLEKAVPNQDDTAHKLEVLHATDGHFRAVVNYKNYSLIDRSQKYNGNMAAKMGGYVKRIKTLMKA